DPRVARLPADRHNVNLTVAVQIRRRQVLHRHAAVVDYLPGPLGAFAVRALVDANAAALTGFHAQVIADADDQLVVAVAVEVGRPDAVGPLEWLVDHVTVPHFFAGVVWLGVDNDLIAVPRLDGGDVLLAVLELALLDLAGAAIAFRVGLVALADMRAGP